jgi:hypothetical protein
LTQVREREAQGLDNRERLKVGKSVARILSENLLTLFNFLNLGLAIAVLAVGSFRNALFMGVVFTNAVIGTFQAIRAKKTVEKLKLVVALEARVIRDGKTCTIPVERVVLDDLMLFETGNQILADAVLKGGEVEADESLLTGESLPVKKKRPRLHGEQIVGEDAAVFRYFPFRRRILPAFRQIPDQAAVRFRFLRIPRNPGAERGRGNRIGQIFLLHQRLDALDFPSRQRQRARLDGIVDVRGWMGLSNFFTTGSPEFVPNSTVSKFSSIVLPETVSASP